jgi:hypothetical protein
VRQLYRVFLSTPTAALGPKYETEHLAAKELFDHLSRIAPPVIWAAAQIRTSDQFEASDSAAEKNFAALAVANSFVYLQQGALSHPPTPWSSWDRAGQQEACHGVRPVAGRPHLHPPPLRGGLGEGPTSLETWFGTGPAGWRKNQREQASSAITPPTHLLSPASLDGPLPPGKAQTHATQSQ